MTATLQQSVLIVWEGSCVSVNQGMKEMEPFVQVRKPSTFLGIWWCPVESLL